MSYQPFQDTATSVPSTSVNPTTDLNAAERGGEKISKYESALNLRLDIEAALTYSLGCFTGVLFLILETKNDYVRFHAWQSSLIFTTLLVIFGSSWPNSCYQVLHFVVMFLPAVGPAFSWILFVVDIALIVFLGRKAYINGSSLDRFKAPYFGELASKWTDAE